ncbi:hypothetical protein C7212DRAFT_186337, partial [Tuber magnatum]
GSSEWVTVIGIVSGDCRVLRPMIINKGKAHSMGWYAKLEKHDSATFGVSEKGWSKPQQEMESIKLVNNVCIYTAGTEYRLLILDGHPSHYNWEFFNY